MYHLQFSTSFLASLPLLPAGSPGAISSYLLTLSDFLAIADAVIYKIFILNVKWSKWMNSTTALCVSCCGRNLGGFKVPETEFPLSSLPAEDAASDLVLGHYFLTNSLFLPNPQHYKQLSSCWSHHPTHLYSRAPLLMTAIICITLTIHWAMFILEAVVVFIPISLVRQGKWDRLG